MTWAWYFGDILKLFSCKMFTGTLIEFKWTQESLPTAWGLRFMKPNGTFFEISSDFFSYDKFEIWRQKWKTRTAKISQISNFWYLNNVSAIFGQWSKSKKWLEQPGTFLSWSKIVRMSEMRRNLYFFVSDFLHIYFRTDSAFTHSYWLYFFDLMLPFTFFGILIFFTDTACLHFKNLRVETNKKFFFRRTK